MEGSRRTGLGAAEEGLIPRGEGDRRLFSRRVPV